MPARVSSAADVLEWQWIATSKPAPASSSAMARPMRRAAPVTSAILGIVAGMIAVMPRVVVRGRWDVKALSRVRPGRLVRAFPTAVGAARRQGDDETQAFRGNP